MRLTGGLPRPCTRYSCIARFRRGGGLTQRCHRGALPCSVVTTIIPQTCHSMICSWGFGAVPSFDSVPRGLTVCGPRGCPSHYNLSEWSWCGTLPAWLYARRCPPACVPLPTLSPVLAPPQDQSSGQVPRKLCRAGEAPGGYHLHLPEAAAPGFAA